MTVNIVLSLPETIGWTLVEVFELSAVVETHVSSFAEKVELDTKSVTNEYDSNIVELSTNGIRQIN